MHKKTKKKKGQGVQLCTKLSDLLLSGFIAALVEGDLSAIVLAGKPSDDQILEAWDELQQQYIEQTAGGEQMLTILNDGVHRAEIGRINRIGVLLELAIETGHPDLGAELQIDGYEYNPAGSETERAQQVKVIQAMLSGEACRLRLAKDLYGQEEGREEVTIGQEWFDDVLISAGEVMGHYIPLAGFYTSQFCRYYRRLMDHIDRQKKLTSKS